MQNYSAFYICTLGILDQFCDIWTNFDPQMKLKAPILLIFGENYHCKRSSYPKIQLLWDYASALVGKYSPTLYSRIYAPFVEYTPVDQGGRRGRENFRSV